MGKFKGITIKNRRKYFYYFVLSFMGFLLFTQYQNCSSGSENGLVISSTGGGPPGGGNVGTLTDCGSNWAWMGTFGCDANKNQTQQICGCLPPGSDNPAIWINQGNGCFSHITGKGCADITFSKVSCDGTNCVYKINYVVNGFGAGKKSMVTVGANNEQLWRCNAGDQDSADTGNWVPMSPSAPLVLNVYSLSDSEASNGCSLGFSSASQFGYPAGRLVLQGGQ